MIKSKEDLRSYINADRIAFEKPEKISGIRARLSDFIFKDRFFEYMKTLRKLEYYTNLSKRNPIQQFLFYYYGHKLGKCKVMTGIDLDANVAGPGLRISHGKCVVSVDARLGSGCKILSDVTIGKLGPYNKDGAPVIGNNVYIGTGARIIGNIEIADDVVIGANAVVTKSITEKGITVAGIPAKKVSDTDSWWYINRVPREDS